MILKVKYRNPLLIKPTRPLPVSIGIIGAGTIGPDIGYYLKSAIAGLKLTLVDINEQALINANERILAYVEKGLSRGKLSKQQGIDVRQNIFTTTDYADLADCDWVIEAATEDLELKRKIFTQVESIIRNDAMITSNTSSIPAESLYSHLEYPERTTVTHFFAPAFSNPAVEVINWEKADEDFIEYLRWLFCITGKLPMLTKDAVCFMLDRIFDNWCNEAGLLLDDATPGEVDFIASEFVHVGPFYVLNFSNGNPIIIETNTRQMEYEGEHYRPASVFESADKWKTIKPGEHIDIPDDKGQRIRDRLLGVLFSQSYDIIDRKIGAVEDLDLGCRLAFAFKQGPLELAKSLGAEEAKRIVERFNADRPGMPIPQNDIPSYEGFKRHILVDIINDVVVITLRRPEAMNALHDDMTDEILDVFKDYENDSSIKGYVITGYGPRAFCAGADIGRFVEMLGKHEECVEYARVCSRLLVYMDQCPRPIVAALNGMALGGGLELAIRCDEIIATNNSWMQFPEIGLGIVPGIGGMVVPYRRWPHAAAVFHEMLLKTQKLDSTQALELGVLSEVVDSHEELLSRAIDRVRAMDKTSARHNDSPVSLESMPVVNDETISVDGKMLSQKVSSILLDAITAAAKADDFQSALEIGYEAFAQSGGTAAAREGINAFMSRRQPDFSRTG
jgi:enoyl-CoA hydratase/3-hydroxyacyl-CoA dehydrogenase